MKSLLPLLFCLVLVLSATGCGPAQSPPPTYSTLASASSGALTVELKAAAPLSVGLNRVRYLITQDGQPITKATLVQRPVMNMSSMKHACPLVDPSVEANAEGLFEGALIFNMASTDNEYWELTVDVTVDGESQPTSVSLGKVPVADSAARKSVKKDDETYLVTLNFEGGPQVGKNTYTVTVHRAEDKMKMKFLPLTDFTLTATPEMPSMGHGSSGNVNPAHVSDGLYQGTVNFSMAGEWVLHLDLAMPGDVQLGRLDWVYSL